MVHIGYFSLLLFFCISTNMIHSMCDFMDFPQKKPFDLWEQDYANSNNPILLPLNTIFSPQQLLTSPGDLPATSPEQDPFISSLLDSPITPSDPFKKTDTFQQTSGPSRQQTEEQQKNSKIKINSDHSIETTSKIKKLLTTTISKKRTLRIKKGYRLTMGPLFGKKLVSLSHKNPDCPIVTVTEKKFYTTTPSGSMTEFIDRHTQSQSIPQSLLEGALRSLNKTESLMSSDDECSTFDDQEPITLEQLFPEQSPRKKRKINTKDIPNDARFTIICIYCYSKPKFRSINKDYLTSNFQQHSRKTHKNIAEDEINNYINEHLKEPKRLLKFSVNCPLPTCNHTAHTKKNYNLKENLWYHVLKAKEHRHEPRTWSKESLADYIEQNYTSELVPNPNFSSKVHSNYVC